MESEHSHFLDSTGTVLQSLPKLCETASAANLAVHIARGFWAVTFSWAAWKRSWVGCDPTQSKMAADRSVAITGDMVWAQLLTA